MGLMNDAPGVPDLVITEDPKDLGTAEWLRTCRSFDRHEPDEKFQERVPGLIALGLRLQAKAEALKRH